MILPRSAIATHMLGLAWHHLFPQTRITKATGGVSDHI